MKETAVVICNWNKKEYVVNCIASVCASTYRNYDLIVVDNASTDGSVEAIRERFGSGVILLRNEQNIGGAGGFNTGIQYALEHGYRFIHLLDNDVVLDREAIGRLREALVTDPKLGIAGSLIYDMDHPEIVQEMGAMIDWSVFHMKLNYKGHQDTGNLPDDLDCDYVPACSMMIRREVLDRIGTMDEQYFIYWDDVDLCHRVKREGYRVAAFSSSKAWHKRGVAVRNDTFANYYVWRNRVYFFAKYSPNEKLDDFIDHLFDEWFRSLFFSHYKGQPSIARTIVLAIEDALHQIRGRAQEQRIFHREPVRDPIGSVIREAGSSIVIVDSPALDVMRLLIERARKTRDDLKVRLLSEYHSPEVLRERFPDHEVVSSSSLTNHESVTVIKTCAHVLDERDRLSDQVTLYVDAYFNTICDEQDRKIIRQYDEVYNLYKNIHLPVLRIKINELRQSVIGV